MKRMNIIVALILLAFLLTSCSKYKVTYEYTPVEQPHLYWKDITVQVVSADCRHWYASGHHYTADIEVYSEEYDLARTFHLTFNDAKDKQDVRSGDILKAQLYSWKMDSTGEIIKREINKIY